MSESLTSENRLLVCPYCTYPFYAVAQTGDCGLRRCPSCWNPFKVKL